MVKPAFVALYPAIPPDARTALIEATPTMGLDP